MNVAAALKSRKTAAVALALSVLVFTPVGVSASFASEGKRAEMLFYEGIPDKTYTKPSINAQLNTYADAMLGYATVAAKYPDLAASAAAMIEARRGLFDAKTVMEKYRAYIGLALAFSDLREIIVLDGRRQSDYDAWNDYGSTGHGANMYIKKAAEEYNGAVDRLLDMADAFPIRYIGGGSARPSLAQRRFGDSDDWLEST
ncbi:MAG: hypothetical protein LBC21_05440 [Oscillospiraceae bacterium]|nr:hypothetical protein [Oscillospiraceae bacterium]